MNINLELEKELYKILTTSTKRWSQIILTPSEAMIEKYPLAPQLKNYIFSNTTLLNDREFNYSLHTRVHWILRHLDDFPKCEKCGGPIKHWNVPCWKDDYKHTCCKTCERLMAQENSVKHFKEVYGVENAFQIPAVVKYLSEHSDEYEKQKKITKANKFGDPNYNNTKQACRKKIEKYGSIWNIKKCIETQKKLREEGKIDNFAHSQETKRINGSFNTSDDEERVFLLLKTHKWPNIQRQYKSEKYPFACDFYIPEEDLYIEFMGSWTHGSHHFDKNNQEDLNQLKIWSERSEKAKKENKPSFYENAIHTWTVRDPNKYKYVIDNKLNYKEFWNIREVCEFLGITDYKKEQSRLIVRFDYKKAAEERDLYVNSTKVTTLSTVGRHNFLIKYFQQDQFFKEENNQWMNDTKIQDFIISNRAKFLEKESQYLSDLELLEGFTKSGKHKGYSHFNPFWFKWFIDTYNVKTCYDPCGGWGHRLLGGLKLEKYIYNDISLQTMVNVKNLAKYVKFNNGIYYNNNARTFVPNEKFEAMFTCPPYFNVEHYECGDFKDRQDFDDFLNSLFNLYEKTIDCRIFGIVIREDLLGNHNNYINKYCLTSQRGLYLSGKQQNMHEYLYIFKK